MADQPQPQSPSQPDGVGQSPTEAVVVDPQKLIRIASVTREVLEEARRIRQEPGAIDHLLRVHGQITQGLREALPPPLFEELDELTPDIRDGSLEELALAHAEILGWLEGLFQGTQLALQVQAAQALDQMRRPSLPRDRRGTPEGGEEGQQDRDSRYL